jgi:hypothetical protein
MRTAKEKAAAAMERQLIVGELLAEIYALDGDPEWCQIAAALRATHDHVRRAMHPDDREEA